MWTISVTQAKSLNMIGYLVFLKLIHFFSKNDSTFVLIVSQNSRNKLDSNLFIPKFFVKIHWNSLQDNWIMFDSWLVDCKQSVSTSSWIILIFSLIQAVDGHPQRYLSSIDMSPFINRVNFSYTLNFFLIIIGISFYYYGN